MTTIHGIFICIGLESYLHHRDVHHRRWKPFLLHIILLMIEITKQFIKKVSPFLDWLWLVSVYLHTYISGYETCVFPRYEQKENCGKIRNGMFLFFSSNKIGLSNEKEVQPLVIQQQQQQMRKFLLYVQIRTKRKDYIHLSW